MGGTVSVRINSRDSLIVAIPGVPIVSAEVLIDFDRGAIDWSARAATMGPVPPLGTFVVVAFPTRGRWLTGQGRVTKTDVPLDRAVPAWIHVTSAGYLLDSTGTPGLPVGHEVPCPRGR